MYYIDKQAAIFKSKELPDEVRKILATPLTRIFIEEKDESELPFIAKSVVSGMFLTGDDVTKVLFQKAWVNHASLTLFRLLQVPRSLQSQGALSRLCLSRLHWVTLIIA